MCIGVLAALVLSIACTGIALSLPLQKGKPIDEVANSPIGIVHSGHGFALKDDGEFHVLMVHIVSARRIQPAYVRGLMAKGMSIKDIRAEIMKCNPAYRGRMQLGENYYGLINLSVAEKEGDRVFDADVVCPIQNAETNVGYISITAMRYEGVWIGDGKLTMGEGDYSGEYRVLLDVLPPRLL